MATITFKKVLGEARALPPDDRQKLIDMLLAETSSDPSKRLERLMVEQGTRPMKFEDLLPPDDISPDESADEMVNWIYEQRSKDSHRRFD